MSTLTSPSPSRAVRGLLAAGLVSLALGALWTPVARAEQTSAEFSEKYNAGAQAYQKKDYAGALRSGKEARAVARSGFERQASLKLILAAATSSRNYQESADALEQLLTIEGLPAAEKLNYHKTLAQVYGALNLIARAITEMKEYLKGGGGSPQDYEALAMLYFGAKDCSNALQSLDRALGGGRQPTEEQLKVQARCYFQMNDTNRLLAASEDALHRFPKKDYYTQVLRVYQERKIDDLALAELLRLGFEHDWLEVEGDYVKLADLALDVGTTAEAQRVLEKGIAKKQVKNADKTERLLKQAKDRAAEDAKTASQLDAEARAGKNGEADVRLGYRYYSMGQYDKAVEAIQRGLGAERLARVKRPDDANMILGLSFLKLKKKPEAEKAFSAAKADPRMAAAAKVWLNAI